MNVVSHVVMNVDQGTQSTCVPYVLSLHRVLISCEAQHVGRALVGSWLKGARGSPGAKRSSGSSKGPVAGLGVGCAASSPVGLPASPRKTFVLLLSALAELLPLG